MADEKLRAVVQEIQSELTRAEGLSPGARRSLEELVRDLHTLAERPAGSPPEDGDSLRERLADAVRRVEASHPVLSTTLGNVIDALAFFGL
jgi:broad specificity phosphatase PhoE